MNEIETLEKTFNAEIERVEEQYANVVCAKDLKVLKHATVIKYVVGLKLIRNQKEFFNGKEI
jgi:hypothetical protein